MREDCEHRWEKIERVLDDDFSYYYHRCANADCNEVVYEMGQLQKLEKYSEKHQFMFLEDWILSLFYVCADSYIIGRNGIRRQISYLMKEFASEERIRTETLDHNDHISDAVDIMVSGGLAVKNGRKGSKSEKFTLTDAGKERAKRSFDKLTDDQKDKLVCFRKGYQTAVEAGLHDRVYSSDLGSTQALESKKIK
jgi:hypothetical protein